MVAQRSPKPLVGVRIPARMPIKVDIYLIDAILILYLARSSSG
jgi:hypothetical protein